MEEDFVSVSLAIIKLRPAPDDDNAYRAGTVVDLRALPRTPGYEPVWNGVDSHSGHTATVRMDANRSVEFLIGAPIPTPTPEPTRQSRSGVSSDPTPTPVPAPIVGGKLAADDGAAFDQFGRSAAISGNTVVVGAYLDDTNDGNAAGSAYVYVPSGGGWVQQQKLAADDGSTGDLLGISVSISGDTVVVGAYGDDTASGNDTGSAYVFVRDGGIWSQEAKLVAGDGAQDDWLGFSVAVDGDTLVVGAPNDDDQGSASGSAYVFTRSGTTWSQQAKLTASDGAAGNLFGKAVSISGDTVVVGAQGHDPGAGSDSGAAYVFFRSGTAWSQQAKLTASDGAEGDWLGFSVAISGDTVVTGAQKDDDQGADSGSAYVFVRNGIIWSQQAKLTGGDSVADDGFGYSVAISGDNVLTGAYLHDTASGSSAGTAYLFQRSGNTWTQQRQFAASDGANGDRLGSSVGVSGAAVVAGANKDDDKGTNSGSAYVFAI